MRPISYHAYVHEAEPGTFLVRFFDVPEAITQGDTLEEAIAAAHDALSAALEGYIEAARPLPPSSAMDPAQAEPGWVLADVPVDPKIAARAVLADRMREEGLSKAGLAQRMGKDEKVARRILNGENASLDLVLEALQAVGVRAALAV